MGKERCLQRAPATAVVQGSEPFLRFLESAGSGLQRIDQGLQGPRMGPGGETLVKPQINLNIEIGNLVPETSLGAFF